MPTLGDTAKPTWGQEWWGLNTINQQAQQLTFPPPGPWRVTELGAWIAGQPEATVTS